MSAYQKLSAEFYDLDKPLAPGRGLAFYAGLAGQADGPILEPMCGSGRFLVPMAERGHDIDGVDSSKHMLAACQQRLTAAGVTSSLYEQSILTMALPRRYRFAFVPDGSLNLLTRDGELLQALTSVRRTLTPGGVFAFEIETTERLVDPASTWPDRCVTRPDGAQIVLSSLSSYENTAGIIRSRHRYDLMHGESVIETELEAFDLRLHQPDKVVALLRECGFANIEVLRESEPREPDRLGESVVFVCRR